MIVTRNEVPGKKPGETVIQSKVEIRDAAERDAIAAEIKALTEKRPIPGLDIYEAIMDGNLEPAWDSLDRNDPELATSLRLEILINLQESVDLSPTSSEVEPEVAAEAAFLGSDVYAEGDAGTADDAGNVTREPRRYYPMNGINDRIERRAIRLWEELFGVRGRYEASVQPNSHAQAVQIGLVSVANPDDEIIILKTGPDGYRSHGESSFVMRAYKNARVVNVDPFDEASLRAALAGTNAKVILYNASEIDSSMLRRLADSEAGLGPDTVLFADLGADTIAALGKQVAFPAGAADFIAVDTRAAGGFTGGVLFASTRVAASVNARVKAPKSQSLAVLMHRRGVIPGVQGGPLLHIIAAKALQAKWLAAQGSELAARRAELSRALIAALKADPIAAHLLADGRVQVQLPAGFTRAMAEEKLSQKGIDTHDDAWLERPDADTLIIDLLSAAQRGSTHEDAEHLAEIINGIMPNDHALESALLQNPLVTRFLARGPSAESAQRRSALARFLVRDSEKKRAIFGAIDRMSDAEVLQKADRLHRSGSGYLSFAQLYARPTAGYEDLSRLIFEEGQAGKPVERMQSAERHLERVYLALWAMEILSRLDENELILGTDVDEENGQLYLYLTRLLNDEDFAMDTGSSREQLRWIAADLLALWQLHLPTRTQAQRNSLRNLQTLITLLKRNPRWKAAIEEASTGARLANAPLFDTLAQRVIPDAKRGATTGQVALSQAIEKGANGLLAGHSEVRKIFGETNTATNEQLKAGFAAELRTIMLAVGESGVEKKEGRTEAVVRAQVTEALAGLTSERFSRLIIAYEPRWAIKGEDYIKDATAEDAQSGAALVRGIVRELHGDEAAQKLRVLYGGSVTKDNAAEYLNLPDVDGLLVGGKSARGTDFAPIVLAAVKVGPRNGRVPYIGGNLKTYATDEADDLVSALREVYRAGRVEVGLIPDLTAVERFAESTQLFSQQGVSSPGAQAGHQRQIREALRLARVRRESTQHVNTRGLEVQIREMESARAVAAADDDDARASAIGRRLVDAYFDLTLTYLRDRGISDARRALLSARQLLSTRDPRITHADMLSAYISGIEELINGDEGRIKPVRAISRATPHFKNVLAQQVLGRSPEIPIEDILHALQGDQGARLPEISGTDVRLSPASETTGARLPLGPARLTEELRGFFGAIAEQVNPLGARLALADVPADGGNAVFTLTKKNGVLEASAAFLAEPIRGQKLAAQDGEPTPASLVTLDNALNENVSRALVGSDVKLGNRLIIDYTRSEIAAEAEDLYAPALAAEIVRASRQKYGQNVSFVVSDAVRAAIDALAADGAEIPAGLLLGAAEATALEKAGVRRVRFTTERDGFDASSVNILAQELKADRAANTAPAPAFRAKLIIAIYAGNIDLTRIPTGFLNAWSTAAGVSIPEQTMRKLLNGTLSMDEAIRFALRPLTEPVDFNAIVRMTEMMRRNVLRAA